MSELNVGALDPITWVHLQEMTLAQPPPVRASCILQFLPMGI